MERPCLILPTRSISWPQGKTRDLQAQAQPRKLSECNKRDTNSGHHNPHRKGDNGSNCGRRDSASRNGNPRDQQDQGLGSRHDLGSFQSVANKIPIAGALTILAKENRHSHGGRNDPPQHVHGNGKLVSTSQMILSIPEGARAFFRACKVKTLTGPMYTRINNPVGDQSLTHREDEETHRGLMLATFMPPRPSEPAKSISVNAL